MKFDSGDTLVVTPKLDGAAVALRYINGNLNSVVTRGNGEYGDDITRLFVTDTDHTEIILNIPLCIKTKVPVQITGELVAPKKIPNARNYAAGALGLKDINEFCNRNLKFIAYDMQKSDFETYLGTLFYLRDQKFNTVYTCNFLDDYPHDGRVYRLESNNEYYKQGFTSKHPRGAYALKERTEGIKTTINDVIWQTGKSGKVTPIALLEPIDIDGATVSRATLNNPGFIEALGVEIGDSVMVERAGGIIPRIIRKAE